MTAEPVGDYEITPHARFEMERRGLREEVVRRVLATPAQRLEIRPGRPVPQSRISMGEPAKNTGSRRSLAVFLSLSRKTAKCE